MNYVYNNSYMGGIRNREAGFIPPTRYLTDGVNILTDDSGNRLTYN